jgi:hypothetical protein
MWRSHGGPSGLEHGFVIGDDPVHGGSEFVWARPDKRFVDKVGLAEAGDLWEGLGLVWSGGVHLHRKSSRASGGDRVYWQSSNEAVGRQIPDFADFYTVGPHGEVTVIRWVQDPNTGKWVIRQWVETTVEELEEIASEEGADGGDDDKTDDDGGESDSDGGEDGASKQLLRRIR